MLMKNSNDTSWDRASDLPIAKGRWDLIWRLKCEYLSSTPPKHVCLPLFSSNYCVYRHFSVTISITAITIHNYNVFSRVSIFYTQLQYSTFTFIVNLAIKLNKQILTAVSQPSPSTTIMYFLVYLYFILSCSILHLHLL